MSDSEYAGPSGSACRVPVHNLKTVAFPDCASKCAFVEIMGVGECESACPWKFEHTGNPVDGEKLTQNDQAHRPEITRTGDNDGIRDRLQVERKRGHFWYV